MFYLTIYIIFFLDVNFGRGGTQEEILMGAFPQLHIISLIGTTMERDQTIIFTNAKKFGEIKGFFLFLF